MRVALAALLTTLATISAQAENAPLLKRGERATVTFPTAGCADTGDTRRFVTLMAEGDREAAMKFVLKRGEQCLPYEKGLQVAVEDVSASNGMACVRQRGEPECRWLPFGFLTTSAAN